VEAVAEADVVITMVTDADAVIDVVGGPGSPLAVMGEGAVWVQMSTVGPDGIDRCAALAARYGVPLVDAPVIGPRSVAEAGQLIVLASGPEDTALRQRVQPIFDVVGGRTVWLGQAGSASRMKLVVNSWTITMIEGGAETLTLAEGLGLDPADFLAVIDGSPLEAPYLRMRALEMLARDFTPASKLSVAAKDSRLVVHSAKGARLSLPVLETIARQFTAAALKHGDEDVSAVFKTVRPERQHEQGALQGRRHTIPVRPQQSVARSCSRAPSESSRFN
jgi:3-hydroxyisobutyrate dehydrogenase